MLGTQQKTFGVTTLQSYGKRRGEAEAVAGAKRRPLPVRSTGRCRREAPAVDEALRAGRITKAKKKRNTERQN